MIQESYNKQIMVSFYIVCVVLFCLCYSVHGKSSGALVGACTSMVPTHPGSQQTGAAPFSLTTDKSSYEEGSKIMVTLTKKSNNQFKGYLIQARDTNGNIIPGFKISGEGQFLTCSNTDDSVTHTEPSQKNTVSFEFTAPSTSRGNITMYATAVESYNTYWVKIPSQPLISVSGATQGAVSKVIIAMTFAVCFLL